MADVTLEALIPKTQELLQPLIAKPKLADKLLAKPPFRFLHDIFTALIQSTGFAKGLYNDFEMDSGNIKEKLQKTTYLDKMIMCVNQTLGKETDVRSSKIVAGLEAENTNIFLQELARAASDSSLGWDRAVQKTLAVYPSPVDGGAMAAPAEAKTSEPVGQATSKESSGPSDEEKAAAAATAAAEAKARDTARKQKEKEDQEKRERELKVEAQRRENEEIRAKAEAKVEAVHSKPNNNTDVDGGAVAQMIKEINGDVERTKDMIEKIISKPKMTANLLSKPPFRFLHDTVTAITKATGFAEGLYNAEELDSQNIKEKQPKIDYLNKIIQCVSVHLNIEVDAKPAKIVAGLEPDDTNKFLQLLAIACRTGDSKSSVERVLSGDVALRVTPTGSESKHSTPKVSSTKQSPAMEPEAKLSSRSSTPSESKKNPTKEAKGSDDGSTRPSSSVGPLKALSVRGNEDEEENTNLRQESKDGGDLERGHGSNTSSGTSRTSRPTTARRRPPKIKENVKEAGRLLAVADNKLVPTVGIMRDGDNAESDDDNETPEGPSLGGGGNNSTITSEDGASHSKLVRNILKDQKAEEEAARKQKEEEEQKETTGEDTGIRLGKKRKSHRDKNKNGASSVAEFNEIRENIQKICQASNPVGKLIEFVHEDLDQMTKELDKWKKEYEKKCEVYEEEKKKKEEALQPLQVQLIEVEEQIKEQVHKINTLKATIAKNEEKTQKLLRMVVSA